MNVFEVSVPRFGRLRAPSLCLSFLCLSFLCLSVVLTVTGALRAQGDAPGNAPGNAPGAAGTSATPSAAPAGPVFEDGQAQIVPAFENPDDWIRHDLWVETSFDSDDDGALDRMHVSVTRPKQTDTEGLKVPVIYISSPYFSGTGANTREYFWNPVQEIGGDPPKRTFAPPVERRIRRPSISKSHTKEWVPRGFAVVHSCSPGTGLSQGCPTVGGDNESLAPKAVVDWLCGRAPGFTSPDGDERVVAGWSTGKVGMTGTSYNGTLALAAATTGVEGLEAIIPIAPNTSYYHYYRSNGLVRHPGGYVGEDIDVLYEFIHSGDPARRDDCNRAVRDEMLREFDRKNGDYNEFWASRDYIHDLGPLRAATLMAHAFNDWNVMPEHSVRIYEALRAKGVPTQAYFHQGGHGGEPPMRMMNRWFTRYLYGLENGVENDPRAWIVRGRDDRQKPTAYENYPHPQAAPVVLYPRRSERLEVGGNGRGALGLEPGPGEGLERIVDNYSFRGDALAEAEWTDHRLLYATPELTRAVHVSGTAEITIRLAVNRPQANLSVWLVALPWEPGAKVGENVITRGWADPQNHRSLTESEELEPGRFYRMRFDLQPDDQVIPPGKRIGLMIFSSDRDFTLRPLPGVELTVDVDATSIELPVVGGQDAFQRAITRGEQRRI